MICESCGLLSADRVAVGPHLEAIRLPDHAARLWLSCLIVSLVFFTSGCLQKLGRSYELDVDPAFSLDLQSALIGNAADDWTAKVGVVIRPVIKTCSGAHFGVLCVHASTQAYVNAHAKGCPALGCSAFTQWHEMFGLRTDGGETWVAADTFSVSSDSNLAPTIFEHELGHGMGLVHTGTGTLMAPEYPDDAHAATPEDVAQWESYR